MSPPQAVASKLHGVDVEVEVIRRKGDVIELTEPEIQVTATSTAPQTVKRVEQAESVSTSKSNNHLVDSQEAEQRLGGGTDGDTTSQCEGNNVEIIARDLFRNVQRITI